MMNKKILNTFLILLACGLWFTIVFKYFSKGDLEISQDTPTFEFADNINLPLDEDSVDFVPSRKNPFAISALETQFEIKKEVDSLNSHSEPKYTPSKPIVTPTTKLYNRARIEYHGTVKRLEQTIYVLKINKVLVRLNKGQIFENVRLISGNNHEIEVLNNGKKEIILRL